MGKQIDLVKRQGMRLKRLIGDLLDVSQIEAGPLPLRTSEVELGALLSEVVESMRSDIERAKCSVSIRGTGPVVGTWDRTRIERLVINLLSNAIKFGAGKPVEISFDVRHGVALLTIRDYGLGIAPEQRERIFARFERAVSAAHYGGLGLGLYIARNIVTAHGGSIRCESQSGAGATFIVELPCARPGVRRVTARAGV